MFFLMFSNNARGLADRTDIGAASVHQTYRRRSTRRSAIAFDHSCHLADEVRQVDIPPASSSSAWAMRSAPSSTKVRGQRQSQGRGIRVALLETSAIA